MGYVVFDREPGKSVKEQLREEWETEDHPLAEFEVDWSNKRFYFRTGEGKVYSSYFHYNKYEMGYKSNVLTLRECLFHKLNIPEKVLFSYLLAWQEKNGRHSHEA